MNAKNLTIYTNYTILDFAKQELKVLFIVLKMELLSWFTRRIKDGKIRILYSCRVK